MTKVEPGTPVLPITQADLAAALVAADLGSLGIAGEQLSADAADNMAAMVWAQLHVGRPKRVLQVSLYEGADGDHRWRVVAPNGETMEASEGYTRKHDARRGATTLLRAPMVLVPEGA